MGGGENLKYLKQTIMSTNKPCTEDSLIWRSVLRSDYNDLLDALTQSKELIGKLNTEESWIIYNKILEVLKTNQP